MSRKNLLTRIGETIDQYQVERQQSRSEEQAIREPTQSRRWATRLLPNPGTVIFTVLVVAALLWAQSAGALTLNAPAAASTGVVAYQGRLADTGGAPLTGTYNMVFRLYAATSGGASLWEEQWTGPNSVQVSDGLFNVMLGSLTPIPQTVVAANPNLFLGITVGTDSEMSPRVQLGSVPFAVQALTVPDGSITTEKLDDGAITTEKLNVTNGLNVSGNLAISGRTIVNSYILQGAKSVGISQNWTTVLQIRLPGNHTSSMVSLWYGGVDWPCHSATILNSE